MSRPRPVVVAFDQVFGISDLDATAGEKRPYCKLNAKVRENDDLSRCMSESYLCDSSKIAGGFVDYRMPCGVVDVVYMDRIVICK